MSVLDQRHKSATGPSPSPSSSPFLQRTGGVSPTRRTSSRKLSSLVSDPTHALRRSTSRRISRDNPPHVNKDIAQSQFASMTSRPHTPVHQDSASTDTSTTLVNPTSTILQGLIKEQRATRGSRKIVPQIPEDVDHTPTSQSLSQSHENSPSEKQRRINSFASSGLKQPRDMGIREMDQYVSKLNKLNFDLKLEIFHRTQQIATLENKMERMHAMEEELGRMHELEDELDDLREVEENNQRLREANEELQSELDRRDQAISEAVDLICQLEAKVEELQTGRSNLLPHTSTLLPDETIGLVDDAPEVCTPKAQAFVDIPDRTSSRKGTARRPRKSPSFLREESRSTAALRSLFMAEESKSVRSFSASTMETTIDSMTDPQSPRLSVLSECSYFSPQDMQPEVADYDRLERLNQVTIVGNEPSSVVAGPANNRINDHLSDRISDWIQVDGHTSHIEPSNGSPRRARAHSDISRDPRTPTRLDEPFQPIRKTRRNHRTSPRQPHLDDFGGQLPPTPDTMSTFRPGFGNGSNASLPIDSRAGSLVPLETSPSAVPRLSRPRSADEITTRPSTSMSIQSDGIDTTASVNTQNHVGDQHIVPGLLSSFNHFGRGSAKATRVLGPGSPSNPRLSCYGGDLLFNGEGVENVTSIMQMTRTPSSNSNAPHEVSDCITSSAPLTPQEWLEAAKAEDERIIAYSDNEKLSEMNSETYHDQPATAIETPTDDSTTPSRNPPLRLQAWANHTQPVAEVQPRRRLSLRPRFFTRNRQQQEVQLESVSVISQGPSPVPDKSLAVPKHRRTNSGPGFNMEGSGTTQGDCAAGRASSRPVPKPLSELRPSTASRPMTSDSAEPRSKGSLLLGWMKGSNNKDSDAVSNKHIILARTAAERPKSIASIDISTLNLARGADIVTTVPDDEPVWRARRRSRRMA